MNVRARLTQFRRDRRQCLGAVDQNLYCIPGPHRRIPGGPPPDRRPERARPADPPQTPLMMTADLLRDQIAEPTRRRLTQPPKRSDRRTRDRVCRA
jgi:hypothetical protein